jgi:hypothetical protein
MAPQIKVNVEVTENRNRYSKESSEKRKKQVLEKFKQNC